MPSRLDALVTSLAAAWAASGGATSVTFEVGALRQAEHGGAERIIFVRQRGTLLPSTAPARVCATGGTATSAGGTGQYWSMQSRTREEIIACELRFPDETQLDAALDRFVAVVDATLGARAFEAAGNTYAWFQSDSTAGAGWETRCPAVTIFIVAKLAAVPLPSGIAIDLAAIGATAGLTSTGATAPDLVVWTVD